MEWLRALKRKAYEAYEAPLLPCVDQALSTQHFPHLELSELKERQKSWSSLLLRFQTLRLRPFMAF